eukprot:GILK01011831.1.p1 GENE.GILK01011831.1~~GILK01011831.1.p1  ORF type:complete len:432 (+),score=37.71 GILK01011831.1:109-1404(+)
MFKRRVETRAQYEKFLQFDSNRSFEMAANEDKKLKLLQAASGLSESSAGVDREHSCPWCPLPNVNNAFLSQWRHDLHLLLFAPQSSLAANFVCCTITFCIFFSIMCNVIQSVPEYEDYNFWFIQDCVVTTLFTVEFAARIFSAGDTMRFVLSPLNLLDLSAILPFYFAVGFSSMHLAAIAHTLRIARLARMLRIFRVTQHSENVVMLQMAIRRNKSALKLLVIGVVFAILFFSSLICALERGDWDHVQRAYVREDHLPSPFASIPASAWWTVVTITTVGYGDVVPFTPAGKAVGAAAMLFGVFFFTFPITVLASTFQALWMERKHRKHSRRIAAPHTMVESLEKIRNLSSSLQHEFANLHGLVSTSSSTHSVPLKCLHVMERQIHSSLFHYVELAEEALATVPTETMAEADSSSQAKYTSVVMPSTLPYNV